VVEQRRALLNDRAPGRGERREASGRIAGVPPDRNLTKKASLNAFAQSLEYVARVVVGLVASPLLVTRLGDVAFGVWQFLLQLIGHVGPASGRPGEALKWVVAHDQASTDYVEKRRRVGDAVAVWVLFLPVVVGLGGILAWLAPSWIGVPAATAHGVHLAASVLVVNLALQGIAFLPQSALQGENLGYKRVGISTSLVLLGGGLSVGAVVLGAGLVGLAAATLATTVISGLVTLWIVRTHVPWFGIARPSTRSVRRFLGLSWWFLLWNLVMQLMRASDIVVLGIAGSASLVTSYSLARYIPEAVTTGVAILIFSVMPGLGGLIGAGDLRRAVAVREELMAVTWFAATVAGSGVLLWESSFLRLWVGPGYFPGTVAMLLMVTLVLQWALIRADSNIIDLTLRLRAKVVLGLVSAALSAGLAWVLLAVFDLGIAGLALGFVLGRSVLSIAYPVMIGRLLAISPARQLVGVIRPGLVTGAMFAATALLGEIVHADTWPSFAGSAGGSGLALAAVAFRAGLTADQRGRVWARAREMVKR
jgi:O-antigen/teichoic acid export membrane protein